MTACIQRYALWKCFSSVLSSVLSRVLSNVLSSADMCCAELIMIFKHTLHIKVMSVISHKEGHHLKS